MTVPIGTRAGAVDVVATATGADRTATATLQVTAPPPPTTVGELVTRVVSWIGNAVRTLLGWFGR